MGGNNRPKRQQAANSARPRTRQNRPRLLADLESNTNQLNQRLRSLGLYAANTIGDGNCLFRALSDQLYGSPSKHLELRADICDFVERRKEEYAPFVDDERGIDVHLRCMRQPGTYGGHLELSAFARLKRRDVKVVQPDVVYVMEYRGLVTPEDDVIEAKRAKKDRDAPVFAMTEGPLYVAYHDWEHYSSVRNLTGPHSGLPCIQETQQDDGDDSAQTAPASTAVPATTVSKHKVKAQRLKPSSKPPSSTAAVVALSSRSHHASSSAVPAHVVDPIAIPLPISRDGSPSTSSSDISGSSAPDSLAPITPPDGDFVQRKRSPKRSIEDEEEKDGSVDGRRLRRKPDAMLSDDEEEEQEARRILSFDSDSSLSPPPPDPKEIAREAALRMLGRPNAALSTHSHSPSPAPSNGGRPLTRRQRKAMGLPKPKHAIVIPGGKHPSRLRSVVPDEGVNENRPPAEWEKNGSGRVDARGFKELRI